MDHQCRTTSAGQLKIEKGSYMKLITSACLVGLSLVYSCGLSSQNSSRGSALKQLDSVVEFHIAAGTGNKPWNTAATVLTVKVGQTLHIVNDDSIQHRLHTNGKPCPHGTTMPANGGVYDCVIASTYATESDGAVYDHFYGSSATFYLKAVAQ
jgi:hypothetical protein